jgi:hypothetical protein
MGLKGLRISVEDIPTMTLDRATIVKSGVRAYVSTCLERVPGVTGSHDTRLRRSRQVGT